MDAGGRIMAKVESDEWAAARRQRLTLGVGVFHRLIIPALISSARNRRTAASSVSKRSMD